MQQIPLNADWFRGAVSFEAGDGWIQPHRLRAEILPLYWADRLIGHSCTGAGVRLRIATDAEQLGLLLTPHGEQRRFDVVIDNRRIATVEQAANEEQVNFDSLPAGEKVVEVWLSQRRPVRLRALQVPDAAAARPADDGRPKWVTYGSSITHCGEAHSPARTWPGVVAREHNLDLTCLGFGGECHVDPLLGELLRDLPADVISLKLGINVHGGSHGQRGFAPAVIGLVRSIRQKHPRTPIALVSPIVSPPREDDPGGCGMTLQQMRHDLRRVVELLEASGDGRILYVDGRELFGQSDVEDGLMPDNLHPNGDGYERLGQRFAQRVMPRLLEMAGSESR
ncbi:MAG: GDSL-type esterase/lipase family protein [Phycisphaerae bacterium]